MTSAVGGRQFLVGEVTSSSNDFDGTGPMGKIVYCDTSAPLGASDFNIGIKVDGEAELIVSAAGLSATNVSVVASQVPRKQLIR
jgi:hypothetical protein